MHKNAVRLRRSCTPRTAALALVAGFALNVAAWLCTCTPRDPSPLERLVGQISRITAEFDEPDRCFVDYGTLLGAVRDARAIAWDHDADFSCPISSRREWTSTRVWRALFAHRLVLMMGLPYYGHGSWRDFKIAPMAILSRRGRRLAAAEEERIVSLRTDTFDPQLREEDVGPLADPATPYADIMFYDSNEAGRAFRLRFPEKTEHTIDAIYFRPPFRTARYGAAGLVPVPANATQLAADRYGSDWAVPQRAQKPLQCKFADYWGHVSVVVAGGLPTALGMWLIVARLRVAFASSR